MRWLDLTLESVVHDVACDEALLIEVDGGQRPATLRFWETPGYAVVLGASRRVDRDVHAEACRRDQVPIVRRSSGGGTVLLGPGVLSVALAAPFHEIPGAESVERAQHYVMNKIALALEPLAPGLRVEGSGDLAWAGRKCAGSAQRRLRGALLVHCSILAGLDLERVDRYLAQPERQPAYRQGRTHDQFLVNLAAPPSVIRAAIKDAWPLEAGEREPPPPALGDLVGEKFGNPSWIFRL